MENVQVNFSFEQVFSTQFETEKIEVNFDFRVNHTFEYYQISKEIALFCVTFDDFDIRNSKLNKIVEIFNVQSFNVSVALVFLFIPNGQIIRNFKFFSNHGRK